MFLSAATCFLALSAQSSPTAPVQVMVVGTFHMAGGQDMINPNVKDILGERRQKEMLVLVDHLAKFKPTKIAIETIYGSPVPQQRLTQYRGGKAELTKNEKDQIALRLAVKCNVPEIFGIDWKKDLDLTGVLDH